MRDSGCTERALPVAADTPHGAMGEARLHTHPAAIALHETTTVQIRHEQVTGIHTNTNRNIQTYKRNNLIHSEGHLIVIESLIVHLNYELSILSTQPLKYWI